MVYGVSGEVNYDPKSRVNTFAHVNYSQDTDRLGILLCINGTGILNAWMRRNVAPEGMSYDEMNRLMETVPVGCEGVSVIPFGDSRGGVRVLSPADGGSDAGVLERGESQGRSGCEGRCVALEGPSRWLPSPV